MCVGCIDKFIYIWNKKFRTNKYSRLWFHQVCELTTAFCSLLSLKYSVWSHLSWCRMSRCSVGHSLSTGGPSEATGPSWALSAGRCAASSRAALPWKHRSSQEMWEWRLHIKVSLNLQSPSYLCLTYAQRKVLLCQWILLTWSHSLRESANWETERGQPVPIFVFGFVLFFGFNFTI